MWKVNGRQTTDAKWWQKLTLPLAGWAKNNIRLDWLPNTLYKWYFNQGKNHEIAPAYFQWGLMMLVHVYIYIYMYVYINLP
jgi:hypothetical protein